MANTGCRPKPNSANVIQAKQKRTGIVHRKLATFVCGAFDFTMQVHSGSVEIAQNMLESIVPTIRDATNSIGQRLAAAMAVDGERGLVTEQTQTGDAIYGWVELLLLPFEHRDCIDLVHV